MIAASRKSYKLAELAERVGARLVGDGDTVITGLGSLNSARPGQISHLSSAAYRRYLESSAASAVILKPVDAGSWQGPALLADNPYLTFARVSQLFDAPPELPEGVADPAHVHRDAEVDPTARIAPGAVVGAGSVVGPRVRIFPGAVVGDGCRLEEDVILMPNVVLYAHVRLGPRTIVHSGAVIGADGFGFTPDERGRLETIAQLGGVDVGADVSIGACTSIDRGAIDDTVVEDGVKIDNQVQIGHNCHIGAHSVICGCVGIVGSTRIGRHCVLAGGVGVGGDGPIEICDGVIVSGMTHVSASITEPGVYSGGVLHNTNNRWKRNALRFQRLDELSRRVSALEKRLAADPDSQKDGGV